MIVSSIILGYHGCDRDVAESVIQNSEELEPSKNPYDWLGEGIYFWENSPKRALHWAKCLQNSRYKSKKIKNPAVVGAIIEIGNCLDLSDQASLDLLKQSYEDFASISKAAQSPLPVNKGKSENDSDLLLRYLDCAVINYCHQIREKEKLESFDTVRGVFFEGGPLFSGSRMREKTHIQVAVRSPKSIIGYFRPKDLSK